MAVVETVSSVTARPVLNVGTDASGNVRKLNGSFGSTLSSSEFTTDLSASNQKLLNIVDALEPCLRYEVYDVTKTTTVSLENEG